MELRHVNGRDLLAVSLSSRLPDRSLPAGTASKGTAAPSGESFIADDVGLGKTRRSKRALLPRAPDAEEGEGDCRELSSVDAASVARGTGVAVWSAVRDPGSRLPKAGEVRPRVRRESLDYAFSVPDLAEAAGRRELCEQSSGLARNVPGRHIAHPR